ncbi:MAG: aldehyde ferredoxin oxidoreductase C-terminal domain-containing protein [Candidatus Bathyarchaeia archaeon]
MLKDYYRVRGWNEKGIPKREKLEELGLSNVAKALGIS